MSIWQDTDDSFFAECDRCGAVCAHGSLSIDDAVVTAELGCGWGELEGPPVDGGLAPGLLCAACHAKFRTRAHGDRYVERIMRRAPPIEPLPTLDIGALDL